MKTTTTKVIKSGECSGLIPLASISVAGTWDWGYLSVPVSSQG
jgi:hypothetical protein